MKNILDKNQMVNSTYEVQFFISGDAFYEKYRVKGKDGKTYLLKLYNSSKLSKYDFSNSNLLEVEILASLNMDRIVRLVNNGEYVKDNNKYHYIVLDFISGETLQDKMKREGIFSQYSAVPIILYLLETLQNIHKNSNAIIHNNINLNSIYLDYENAEKPTLTEFGFARYITSKNNSLDLSRLSPFYIAPELYNGISTPQSDIFSIGALLYNLIMGIPPWYIEIPNYQHTQEKFIDAINEKRKEPLNFGIKGFEEFKDEHLKEVIKKALATNIDDRFKNDDEFIKALKREVVIEGVNKSKTETKKAIKKQGAGFSAIAGMQALKNELHNDVIDLLRDTEGAKEYEVSIPNGMLLYGPPRCGKTFFAERFAEEAGFNYKFIRSSDLASIYIHGSQEKIGELFKEARDNAPMIICFDEIDALVPSRDKLNSASQSGEVNEFLTQLNNCGEQGIFVIGTTNYPQGIDTAILGAGRMDIKIYVPVPDFKAREAMFKLYLKNKPVDFSIDYGKLSELTKNYASGDIVLIIQKASRMQRKSRERITQLLLEQVIKDTNPSSSASDLKKYELIREEIENKRSLSNDKNKRRPLGFRRNNED